MEQLKHFSHRHLLSLVQLQPEPNIENSDKEDEDENEEEDEVDFVEEPRVGTCNMCREEIYSFHQCYYNCMDCDYSLHKFCAQLPETQQNHPLHPGHLLTLSEWLEWRKPFRWNAHVWWCAICQHKGPMSYSYSCLICRFTMDIICAAISEHKMDHPSHPHQLQRYFRPMISRCNACGDEHNGTFYHCTTCSRFMIHLNCALLPAKLKIQHMNESFSHSHLLTLVYSFPYVEKVAKFFPICRVCEKRFNPDYIWDESYYLWHYRCDKCQYYVHVGCAVSRKEAFVSSILMPASMGKSYKNFKDEDHPNLICFPFPDENANLVMHHFINKGDVIEEKIAGEMFSHPHSLFLVDTLLNGSVTLHDPMKKVELLCDGCVRPITNVPFYKCFQHNCDFVLHGWCTRLPPKIQHHPDHPEHTLIFLPKFPKDLGVFRCNICCLDCNGFAYGCKQCNYYVDVNCGFIPNVITHEAHPNHLLLRYKVSTVAKYCKACHGYVGEGFHCPTCDFYLHISCALFLPRTIRHKFDKHSLSLRYYPAENHRNEYFCEICEGMLNPTTWFYHCNMCALSIHAACAPIKLQYERSACDFNDKVFMFLNVKFGGIHEITNHPHPLTFLQGANDDDKCMVRDDEIQSYHMILKCITCKFVLHHRCVKRLIEGSSSSGGWDRDLS